MLTTMMEEDWTIVLKLFAASRSRRGDKGRDDRLRTLWRLDLALFVDAQHHGVIGRIAKLNM